ncbi:MAG TPA: TM0106 family RecB-like putative nuclease [Candidatus Limnocylindrales bacterium]|nr:TM0106 family RecB-like putative nuclease [Candidatus Limnocylindrales bacterium]
MQTIDGRPVYAATDLVAYLACEHLTQLERAALAGLVHRPMRDDPELDIIRKRGFEHEKRFLADLQRNGRTAVTVALDGSIEDRGDQLRAAAAETEAAIASGADVIYQATFFDGTWRGHADFLLRVDDPARPSRFGPYHYEVADTKLARHVKASAILQICTYVDLLEKIQGVRPEWMHVALGGSARAVERFRVDDFMAYFRSVRDRFLATMTSAGPAAFPPPETYPEPVEHCDVCRWAAECAARRRTDDHLSLVAGISARQRRALTARGTTTLEALGRLDLPVDPPIEGTSAAALARVREQARIQLEGRLIGPRYELLLPGPGAPVDAERGLASLPPPSRNDLFFDIEGDPYAFDDGLDYLFGVLETDGTFHAFWSREADGEFTLAAERRAFERLMDFFAVRLAADPGLHIYHYAPYEPTALKRLMGRYGTREDEVDGMLRGGVLVDLLRVVRQSLRASVESYSIKRMEPFYEFVREIDLRDAGSSIVAFEQWLELGEGDRPEATHLERIERYNRDDVVSNQRLRDWLETLRVELERDTGMPVPRPIPRIDELPADLTEAQARVQDLVDRLTPREFVPVDATDRSPDHARWLLAQLLGWHRREDKSMWWDFHRLMDLTPEQLVDEDGPIGLLEPVGPLDEEKNGKQTWRYTFPPQDFDLGRGKVCDPARKVDRPNDSPFSWQIGEGATVDVAAGTVDFRRSIADPQPRAIVPLDYVRTVDLQASLVEIGEWVATNGIEGDGPYRAARDLLLGRPPRVGQAPGEPLCRAGESDLEAARRLALALDRTTLPVQGPPGSGKTYSGARMILTLLRAGKRVGITATSHKVIGNLLTAVLKAAESEPDVEVRAVQRGEKDQVVSDERIARGKDPGDVRARLEDGRANLAAGTPWLWASMKMVDAVDVLFVDEAGQISLANVVAISRATTSLVLLGDPQQLDQPMKGTHPPGADRSALAHVLAGAATMPPDRGLFLETTWRLHPRLCDFTSEVFYDGRLEPEPHLGVQRVDAATDLATGVGPRLLEVPTVGADNESPEEADAIARVARSIVEGGSRWVDEKNRLQPVTWEDVLIVAPYNAQVGAIKRRLPADARVGTVDKFQGQEAPISIYSLTTSSPELAPRGMDFLYSRNRLNVATSRARCITIVAASPDLLRVRARTPDQMRLANAFCRYVEIATGRPAPAATPVGATTPGGAATPGTREAEPLTLGL